MRQITIADINVRLRGLRNINPSNNSRILIESAQSIINGKRVRDIKRFIENSVRMDTEVPFYIYAELFDMVVMNGTCTEICNIGNYIAENAVPKVRDSRATNTLLKGRLTRLQHKLSSPVMDSISDAIGNLKPATPATSAAKPSNDSSKREEVATEAYRQMIEKCDIMAHCDRVIENYNKVSKRFNLDKLFLENTRINGIEDTVVELCNMIDTYNMPSTIKFNTVIETAWYGFESNCIPYDKSKILETAVDYFLFKEDGLDSCRQILESTLFYDKNEDMGNIDIFTEEEPETDTESVSEAIMHSVVGMHTNIEPVSESTDFNEIFEKFKKEELPKTDKPESKLKILIDKLYRKDVNSIVDETPDLLRWLRRFFIVGSCAVPLIGPVLAAVSLIADKFITIHKEREELPKMLKCFNNEIKASKTKLQSTDDSEEKKKLEKYIKSLEDARDKISTYYNDLLTDEEQDKRFENMAEDEGYESDDSDFDFDFDDDEFFENSIFGNIHRSITSIIEVGESNAINETSMYKLVSHMNDEDLCNLARLVNRYPETFYKESVVAGINNEIMAIQKGRINFSSILEKSMRSSALANALSVIETETKYDNAVTIFEGANELDIVNEAYRALMIMIDAYENQNHLLEASFTNTLKVASMKLRNAMTKLSDKERNISRSLDIGMNSFKKSIERALTNDNRESIIKGSVLPSFSKILKMCIINAGLIVFGKEVGLVTAVIGTLGYFAVNGKFKAKERQMVIDEIEIELEMCEKYINIAEQRNDMQALRQLLTTKKELERQRQRIKYKMKVDFGQKYYDSKAPN